LKEVISKIKGIILNSKLVTWLISWSKRIKFPGFSGMSIFDILGLLIKSFKNNSYSQRSNSVAFKFFLALFPSLLFMVSLIPFVPIANFQESLLFEIDSVTPSNIYSVIEQTILDLVKTKHHYALWIGIVLSLFYASNGVSSLLNAFNSSNQIILKANPVKRRLVSLGIFAGFSLFLLISLSAFTYGEIIILDIEYKTWGAFAHFMFHLVKWLIMILSAIIGISILYNLGNPARKSWKWMSPGSSLATIIIILTSYLMSYFFVNFSSYNEVYGSIGTLMMVLFWLNITAYILILGFELHALTDAQLKLIQDENEHKKSQLS
jgi:membrane protein